MQQTDVDEIQHKSYSPNQIYFLDPHRVRFYKNNPRLDPEEIEELAASIRITEQYQPIRVVPISGDPNYDFELDDGERRLCACRMLKIQIKAYVSYEFTDVKRFAGSVASNFCRQPHNSYEIALAVNQLHAYNYDQGTIASICGKSTTWVSQYLSLNKLVPEVLELLRPSKDQGEVDQEKQSGKSAPRRKSPLSFQIALLLVPLPIELQKQLAQKVINLGHSAALGHIERTKRELGIITRSRRSGPAEAIEVLDRNISKSVQALAKYFDMNSKEFKELVAHASTSDRRRFADNLTELAKQCAGTANLIRNTLPK